MSSLSFDWIPAVSEEHVIAFDVDFYKLFSLIKQEFDTCYLFESLALPRHQDRYHVMGFGPAAIFKAKGQNLSVTAKNEDIFSKITGKTGKTNDNLSVKNPYKTLQKAFSNFPTSKTHQGGLIGYFCHEAVNYFEPTLHLEESSDFDTFAVGLYLDGLIYDTLTGTVSYYTYEENRADIVKRLLDRLPTHEIPQTLEKATFTGHGISKSAFVDAVESTRQKITQGYSFQSEVGFRSNFDINGDKIAIYNRLREVNPSPYMYYLKFGEQELLGASPEIVVSNKQGITLTTPAAGTTTRGKTLEEDTRLARKLLNDPKEIAEHNMLVDLHRNDLARVSKPGSVRVKDLMFLIKFSHVQHIMSAITSELRDDCDSFDLLASILPCGVTTGAPKIETIKIIDENETQPRGPYGGAVGRFSFNGDCDFCLPIRSMFCAGDHCYAQTSAGVVFDSVPEKEYEEVINKLAAMKQVLKDLGATFDDE